MQYIVSFEMALAHSRSIQARSTCSCVHVSLWQTWFDRERKTSASPQDIGKSLWRLSETALEVRRTSNTRTRCGPAIPAGQPVPGLLEVRYAPVHFNTTRSASSSDWLVGLKRVKIFLIEYSFTLPSRVIEFYTDSVVFFFVSKPRFIRITGA